MTDLLKDKNIVVGVTGSIAIYKSLELIRLFIKSGAKVKVVMSESAKEFITPLTFEAISQNIVLHKESESWANDNNHIGLAKWADIFTVAPATANTINKIGAGIADNLLLESILAFDKKLLIAPSANTKMYLNPNTTGNIKKLKVFGHEIIEPQSKLLACNDEGLGAMAEPLEIFWRTARELLKDEFWDNTRVVVTGGGTVEKIDDVRYISNFSSGKMAESISKALYLRGSDVCLITTKDMINLPNSIYQITAQNSKEMLRLTKSSLKVAKKGVMSQPNITITQAPKLIQKKPYLFMVAAVSDFVPAKIKKGKIKKEDVGETLELKLAKNIDILSNIKEEGIKKIGFKVETDKQKAIENAKKMLNFKNLDAVCLNVIDEDNSFGSDSNEIEFINKKRVITLSKDTKLNISLKILDLAKEL
jgi:phosphopantothenoylcysteine decarboxylase/phosphopantothenate--cysteine ligase